MMSDLDNRVVANMALIDSGDFSAALTDLQSLMFDYPESETLRIAEIFLLRHTAQYEQALKRCEQYTVDFSESSDAWRSLGEVLIDLEQHEEAISVLQKSCRLQPSPLAAYLGYVSAQKINDHRSMGGFRSFMSASLNSDDKSVVRCHGILAGNTSNSNIQTHIGRSELRDFSFMDLPNDNGFFHAVFETLNPSLTLSFTIPRAGNDGITADGSLTVSGEHNEWHIPISRNNVSEGMCEWSDCGLLVRLGNDDNVNFELFIGNAGNLLNEYRNYGNER